MSDDPERPDMPPGEPFIGLEHRHIDGRGRPYEKNQAKATSKSVVGVENAVVFGIIARVDNGPWSLQLAAATTYFTQSEGRAEGIAAWLRAKSARDGTGLEYRVIPLIRNERSLAPET
jgi:hypothetical protein